MHTAITTGKGLLLAAALAIGGFPSVQAEPVRHDFESTGLGEWPSGVFRSGWGERGKGAFMYVTNYQASEGEKSLAIQLLPNSEMGGVEIPLSKGRSTGVVTLEFDYYRENRGKLSFEFRCAEGKWPFFYFANEGLLLRKKSFHLQAYPKGIKPYRWYRVKYVYPLTTKESVPKAFIEMKDLQTGETFGGEWDDWTMKNPEKGFSLWMNYWNDTASPQVMYIDNLRVTYTP